MEVNETDWDALGKPDYPFTRYAFLYGLELHDCLQPYGWHPVYFLIHEADLLVAALPAYIKTNSYGELVFDHAWAQAYERHGFAYYPKLVTAIPYTPATGQRFMFHSSIDQQEKYRQLLAAAAIKFCEQHKLSSWHVLFEQESILRELENSNFMLRCDIQFHWQNHQYQDFEQFLAALSSRKRKNIKKERRSARNNRFNINMLEGTELSDADWDKVYLLYRGIYDRKYGTATLNVAFFKHLGQHMGKSLQIVLVRDSSQIVASSVFFRSDSHLYGRVWGCDHYYPALHFECCYYQGIDYCINNGLQWFDPGAQGEHKLSRGFLPNKTWSGHWLGRAEFNEAITRFLKQETKYIDDYQSDLMKHSPYRQLT
ncbi:MAG: GNAT family N-acetyltransferase [Gammaproteobacteria bacterium]|nr:GNAT family N-acetyltransferase [Gammaproteobacteria bacterium]